MATQRLINTNFWRDTYVDKLDPIEKLLFLYLLTNPQTTLVGIYELPLRVMAMDTGIDKDMLEKMLTRFSADKRAHYKDGFVFLPNFIKHQRLNPSILKGIEKAFVALPDWVQSVADSPQIKEIKRNLKKRKETESNAAMPPASSEHLKNGEGASGYELARAAAERIKKRSLA